ncbi:MAG: 50S ribosomal protein L19 [bacterium]|nr:50S ribosomal protein L19 [bacterium]
MINESTSVKIKPGATVRVFEILKEGDKEQIRRFEGLVLARKHGNEAGATFTVRSTVAGVGVEKVFPIHSPLIDRVEVLSSPSKIRRAKMYFTRGLSRKSIRRKTIITDEKNLALLPDAAVDEDLGEAIAEEKAKIDEAVKEKQEKIDTEKEAAREERKKEMEKKEEKEK